MRSSTRRVSHRFTSSVPNHGFLSYLIKTAVAGNSYTIFGYKGKQVRDNLHATDIGHLIHKIYTKTNSTSQPVFPVVANLGGGRSNSVSVLEVIALLKDSFDLNLHLTLAKMLVSAIISGTSLITNFSMTNLAGNHRFQF